MSQNLGHSIHNSSSLNPIFVNLVRERFFKFCSVYRKVNERLSNLLKTLCHDLNTIHPKSI